MLNTKQLWGDAEGQEWKGRGEGSASCGLHAAGDTQESQNPPLPTLISFFLPTAQTGSFPHRDKQRDDKKITAETIR